MNLLTYYLHYLLTMTVRLKFIHLLLARNAGTSANRVTHVCDTQLTSDRCSVHFWCGDSSFTELCLPLFD